MKDHRCPEGSLPGKSAREKCAELVREATGRLSKVIPATVLCLVLWGCGTVEQTPAPAPEPGDSKSPPVAAQSMAMPDPGDPIEQVKSFLTPERRKYVIAGAVTLLVTFMAGVGFGRTRKEATA